jgi:hypothetical protein
MTESRETVEVVGDDEFVDYETGVRGERRLVMRRENGASILYTYRRNGKTSCALTMFLYPYTEAARKDAFMNGRFQRGIKELEKRVQAHGCTEIDVFPYEYDDNGYRMRSYKNVFEAVGYTRTWWAVLASLTGDIINADRMHKKLC